MWLKPNLNPLKAKKMCEQINHFLQQQKTIRILKKFYQ